MKKIKEITAREWFKHGTRVRYDRKARRIIQPGVSINPSDIVHVFRRITKDATLDENAVWTSFLPGWPDGSFGWAKTNHLLEGKNLGPRLFVEYVGHGESDKPNDYPYSTDERADMVEAQWQAEGIKSTFMVGFDYSSIVALELLSRQLDRLEAGTKLTTKIEGVLLINGGLFAEGHTHPYLTTPVLKSPLGALITSIGQRSKFAFGSLMKTSLWSKDYVVTTEEINQLHDAISRRNGVYALTKSADFVDHHKRNSERLNLERLFHALGDSVSFHVVGSKDDQIEGRQAVMARERLGTLGLDVRFVPGGHLSTAEQPARLAEIIQEVAPKGGRLRRVNGLSAIHSTNSEKSRRVSK